MPNTLQEWWARLTTWLTGSSPTAGREAVEQLLEHPQVKALFATQEAFGRGARGRFGQVLRGGGIPSDRRDQVGAFIPGLPAGLDYQIDEWEGPQGRGWKLVVFAQDLGKTWRLEIPHDGGPGEWQEVTT